MFIDNVNFARAKELGVLFCEYYVLLYITLKLGHRSFVEAETFLYYKRQVS